MDGSAVEWTDVTADFLSGCAALELGELKQAAGFTLHDAMAAIELMDPRMDSGMKREVVTIKGELDSGRLRGEVRLSESLAVIDELFRREVHFLDGNSLPQTLFECLYCHRPGAATLLAHSQSEASDATKLPALVLYALASTSVVSARLVQDAVLDADLCEEEDWIARNYDLDMFSDISLSDSFRLLLQSEVALMWHAGLLCPTAGPAVAKKSKKGGGKGKGKKGKKKSGASHSTDTVAAAAKGGATDTAKSAQSAGVAAVSIPLSSLVQLNPVPAGQPATKFLQDLGSIPTLPSTPGDIHRDAPTSPAAWLKEGGEGADPDNATAQALRIVDQLLLRLRQRRAFLYALVHIRQPMLTGMVEARKALILLSNLTHRMRPACGQADAGTATPATATAGGGSTDSTVGGASASALANSSLASSAALAEIARVVDGAFNKEITANMLLPSPPRCAPLPSFPESVASYAQVVSCLLQIAQIQRYSALRSADRCSWQGSFWDDASDDLTSAADDTWRVSFHRLFNFLLNLNNMNPNVLSRSILWRALLQNGLLCGRTSFTDALETDFQRIGIPMWCIRSESGVAFVELISRVMEPMMKLPCTSKSRVRRRLYGLLCDWSVIHTESAHTDDTVRRSVELPDEDYPHHLSVWAADYLLQLMLLWMSTSIEEQLFAPAELDGVYWYMDYLLSSYIQNLGGIGVSQAFARTQTRQYLMDETFKVKKRPVSVPAASSVPPSSERWAKEAERSLCRALFRLLAVTRIRGLLPGGVDGTHPFGNPEITFFMRFRDFRDIYYPSPLEFRRYKQAFETGQVSTDELMKVTNEYLTSTRDYVMATNKSLAAEAGVVARAKHRPVLHAPQETPCRIWASQPMDAIDPCQIEELFQDEAEVLDVLLPESLLERRVKQVAEVSLAIHVELNRKKLSGEAAAPADGGGQAAPQQLSKSQKRRLKKKKKAAQDSTTAATGTTGITASTGGNSDGVPPSTAATKASSAEQDYRHQGLSDEIVEAVASLNKAKEASRLVGVDYSRSPIFPVVSF